MPYTPLTPPSDGDVLTATFLNALTANIEYLYGLIQSGINQPFASLRVIADLTAANNQWVAQHKHRYLHYKARLLANDNDDLDIFVDNGGAYAKRVYHDGTTRSATYTYSGYIDLDDPESWSDWIGAWDSGTGYNEHDIVSDGGIYWQSLQNGNTNHQPPNASWWQSLGSAGNFLTAGNYYYIYAATNLSASPQFVLDYIQESDSTTL